MNAWIPLMQTALFDAMDAATEDPRVRVIVLTRAGRGFCGNGNRSAARRLVAMIVGKRGRPIAPLSDWVDEEAPDR